MAEQITLSKERNLNDIAIELTQMYFARKGGSLTIDEIAETYSKFYDQALECKRKGY